MMQDENVRCARDDGRSGDNVRKHATAWVLLAADRSAGRNPRQVHFPTGKGAPSQVPQLEPHGTYLVTSGDPELWLARCRAWLQDQSNRVDRSGWMGWDWIH